MKLGDDIRRPGLLKLKGTLFLVTGMLGGAALLLERPNWRDAALLAITVWAFCRAYYFIFYVLEHYAGGRPYAGLWHAAGALWRKRSGAGKTG
jgi:hypothetical protein